MRISFSPEQVHEKTAAIHASLLRESPHVTKGNFTAITGTDLRRLFGLYDREFFDGGLTRLLAERHQAGLSFRLSQRMTRVGGTTASFPRRGRDGRIQLGVFDYEITISTTLLFQSFHDLHRTVTVNGLVCRDRLEALQRIFEHELVHLLEMLVWGTSSCSAPPFKAIVGRTFAHPEVRHDLVTQHERAKAGYGIHVGDRVEFEFEGQLLEGIVNRITRRATILVPNPGGARYSDGGRYLKFYIPLGMLRKRDQGSGIGGQG
ncbi:MAG: SprT-like family protein [Planctomycetes bacterium]|nr:SprT-like family protein [Planctomycetota bacterium]